MQSYRGADTKHAVYKDQNNKVEEAMYSKYEIQCKATMKLNIRSSPQ